MEQRLRRMRRLSVLLWLATAGGVLWVLIDDPRPDLRHPAVLASAWLAVGYWAVTAGLWARYARHPALPALGAWAMYRLWWPLAAASAWLHVGLAMHASHGWSIGRAMEHVATADGTGYGVFLTLSVLTMWAADAAWAAVASGSYLDRPVWVGRLVHGLVGFFVFNAAVVFVPDWPARVAGLAAFTWVGWEWHRGRG